MYAEQHILASTAPMVAALPNTGGDTTVQLALALAVGMVIWGVIYSLRAKGNVTA